MRVDQIDDEGHLLVTYPCTRAQARRLGLLLNNDAQRAKREGIDVMRTEITSPEGHRVVFAMLSDEAVDVLMAPEGPKLHLPGGVEQKSNTCPEGLKSELSRMEDFVEPEDDDEPDPGPEGEPIAKAG